MNHPWNEIDLDDYENHMKLESVMQLQTMNEMMKGQFYRYPAKTIMILGIAGGNGLNHIEPEKFDAVYGVDINSDYLAECVSRYPHLKNVFLPIAANLQDENLKLPNAHMVIANLLIEYIGYGVFQEVIGKVKPQYVSCVIQINEESGFVSDSPYIHAFDRLEEVHHQIEAESLTKTMEYIGYRSIYTEENSLPNGKKLVRIDYQK